MGQWYGVQRAGVNKCRKAQTPSARKIKPEVKDGLMKASLMRYEN